MKNLKPLKYLLYTLCVLLLFANCETDEVISGTENSLLKKGRLENYSELATYVEKLQHQDDSSISTKDSSLEINNGFNILYDQDMFIQEIDSSITYSIPIYKNNQLGGTFSNLVVRFSDTEPTEAFILNYEPTDEYIDAVSINEQTPFEGNVSSESIDYDGSLDSLEKAGGCVTVTTKYCDWDNNQHGDTHLGGDNCTPGYYWYVTTTICFGDEPSLVDVPTPGSGNPSATDYIYTPSTGGGSNGGTVHPPIVVPNVPKTFSKLNIDGLSLETTEWLNQPESYLFKQEMMNFLEEDDPLNRNELEAYLMIKSESSNVNWQNSSGYFNNIPTLHFSQLRHMTDAKGYIYTEFKLDNGDVLMRGDFSETSEFLPLTFYYSKEVKRLFEIPEPYNENPSINLDFLWENFWSTVQTGVRYCTPMEDVVILIDGKDFDGIESSRAVAGVMVLIDIVPVGKVFKIVKKTGQVITNSVPVITRIIDDVLKAQIKAFKRYRGTIANMSNAKKGRWAEMGTDVDMISKGYDEKHAIRITSIDNGGHNGIDHVFKNPQTGEYLIVETKYKPSGTIAYMNVANSNTNLPRQMSDNWLTHNDNLANAVGTDLAEEILDSGYKKIAAIVNPDGTITYRLIDELGNVINTADGIYTP